MKINSFQKQDVIEKIRQKRKLRLYNLLITNKHIIPLFSLNELEFGNYSKIYKWKCLKCNTIIESKIDYQWYSRSNHLSYCRCTKCYPIDKSGTKQKLKKYGNKMGNIDKLKQSKLQKYGNYMGDIKKLKTTIKNFSTEKQQQIKTKRQQTCLNKYGKTSYTKTNDYINKVKTHSLEKYGVESPNQVREFQLKKKIRYSFNGLTFDSMPEIALYIYCLDKKIPIEYQPISLEYTYKNSICQYFPDFRINGNLYEIKGNHLIDKNGNWICPYDSSKNEKYRLKQQCAKKNNVIILTAKDYQKYLTYIDSVYGKHYLQQFKNKHKHL